MTVLSDAMVMLAAEGSLHLVQTRSGGWTFTVGGCQPQTNAKGQQTVEAAVATALAQHLSAKLSNRNNFRASLEAAQARLEAAESMLDRFRNAYQEPVVSDSEFEPATVGGDYVRRDEP